MKAYVVTYKGLWMGGKAVVLANSDEEAWALVEADPKTVNFEGVTITTFDIKRKGRVIFNDNGDY